MNTSERVRKALESFNVQKIVLNGNIEATLKIERYNYGITHWNQDEHENLQKAITAFDAGQVEEETVKYAIRYFRDRSEVGYVDFAIKVLEPSVEKFEQLYKLFEIERDKRVVAPAMEEAERGKRLARKLYDALSLVTRDRNDATLKMRKQFDLFVSRFANPSAEILALQHALSVKAQKELRQFEVSVEYDTEVTGSITKEEFETRLEVLDNAAFEARLKPVTSPATNGTSKRKTGPTVQPAPVEIHMEVSNQHPEFTEFCEQLYLQK